MQDDPNGILAQLQGPTISDGNKLLPRPDETQAGDPVRSVEIDAGRPLGLVRIRYRLMRHKHGKSINWFWTAVHAERVEPV